MPLPTGVETRTVRLDPPVGVLGTPVLVNDTAHVTLDQPIVWAATGDAIYPFAEPVPVVDGVLEFPFPCVDQAGFIDEHGNAITGFKGVLTATVRREPATPGSQSQRVERPFQVLLEDPEVVELALIPVGQLRPENAVAASSYAEQAREYRDEAAAQVGQLVADATTSLGETLTDAEVDLQAIATAAAGSATAAATSAGVASDSAGEADTARLAALASEAAAEAAQVAALEQVEAATEQADAAAQSASASATSASEADADRQAAQIARAGAEAAQAAIPSMPVLWTNGAMNPSFETNTLGWNVWTASGGGAVAGSRETSGGAFGGAYYKGTVTVAGNVQVTLQVASGMACAPGEKVSGALYILSSVALRVFVNLDFYTTATTTLRGQVSSPVVTLVPNVWTRVTNDDATVPALADVVRIGFGTLDAGLVVAGTNLGVDAAMLVRQGGPCPPYFDGSTPGARWVGTAHASASQLLVMRDVDAAFLARTTTRYFEGTGSPESVVAAAPGAEYRDLAKTNGARRWYKDTGTGATGWVVVDGDTGWRNISSLIINGWTGTLSVRRTGNTVEYRGQSLTAAAATASAITAAWPAGFAPGLGPVASRTPAIPLALGRHFTMGSGLVPNTLNLTDVLALDAVHLTDQPWPTTLPGNAA